MVTGQEIRRHANLELWHFVISRRARRDRIERTRLEYLESKGTSAENEAWLAYLRAMGALSPS